MIHKHLFSSLAALPRRWAVGSVVLLTLLFGGMAVAAVTGSGPFAPASGDPVAGTDTATDPASGSSSDGTAVSPSPTSGATEAVADDTAEDSVGVSLEGGGGRNVVMLTNHRDGELTMRGSIQLNQLPAPRIAPENLARAYASCTDCQTLAVAMQINLIKRGTQLAAPRNAAVAINYECLRCVTVAVALQYTYSVDDPTQTPPEVRQLIRAMEAELRAISIDREVGIREAIERINAVIDQFVELAESLDDRRAEATEPTTEGATDETPTPSATPADADEPSPSATTSTASPPSPSPTSSASAEAGDGG